MSAVHVPVQLLARIRKPLRAVARPMGAVCLLLASAGGVAATQRSPPPQDSGTPPAAAHTRLQDLRLFKSEFYAPFRPETALDMVLRTPGFELDMGNAGRGLDGAAGNVLVNGVRPPAKAAPVVTVLAGIPAAQVVGIVLIPAGTRDIDMAGYPVLANVVRKTGDGVEYTTTARAASSGGDGDSRRIEAGAQFNRPRRIVSANASWNRLDTRTRSGWIAPVIGETAARRARGIHSASDQRKFTTSAQWDLPEGPRLQLRGNLGRMRATSQPLVGDGSAPGVEVYSAADLHSGDVATDLQWAFAAGRELSLTALVSRNDSRSNARLRSTERDSMSRGRSRSGEDAARGALRWRLSQGWRIEAGADHAANFLDGEFAYLVDGAEIDVPGSASHVGEQRSGLFASTLWTPDSQWMGEFGLRWEQSVLRNRGDRAGQARFDDLLPRLAATWTPRAGHRLRAEAERSVGQLVFSQFLAAVRLQDQTVTAGAMALQPERSWRYGLGYEWRFGNNGLLNLEAERERIDNPIDLRVGEDGVELSANVGVATIDRLKLDANLPLEAWGLPGGLLTAGHRLTFSHMVDPVTGQRREVATNTPDTWSLALRQDLPGLGAWGISAMGDSEMVAYGARRVTRMRSGGGLSVFGEWRPRASLGLRLSLSDGTRTRTDTTMYATPRTAGQAPGLTHVELDYRRPLWQASLEWMPRSEAQLELGIASGGDTRLVSRTHAAGADGAAPVEQRLDLPAHPTASVEWRLRW